MSEEQSSAEIDRVKIEFHLGATIQVSTGGQDHWIRPGASMAVQFKGLPSDDDITETSKALMAALDPMVEDIAETMKSRLNSVSTGSYRTERFT